MNTRPLSKSLVTIVTCALVGSWLTACDEEKPKPDTTQSVPSATTAEPEREKPPATMPEVTLRPKAVQLGMDELQLSVPSFETAFKGVLAKYPLTVPDQVVLNIDRKVPTPTAARILYMLDDAGAKAIEVRTKPRGSMPETLVIRTEKAVTGAPPPCTPVGMVLDDLGVTFWRVRGGLAKRYSKGMAGPDLSALHEVMHKEVSSCESTVFLFSAEDDVDWGHTYDLATSVKVNDPSYPNISKFVLLRTAPVPGKPVKVGG